jgi:hypothetical protein
VFLNIPAELRERPQWVLWRKEILPGIVKPTKPLYIPRPNSGKASVIEPSTWGTFEDVLKAPLTSTEAVDAEIPVAKTGFTGIGYVFSADDPYCGIDLDDCHGDPEVWNHQLEIYNKFNSYTEYSPSRKGVHIIVKGKVPTGRRRGFIELYPQARFFTMTGDVLNPAPIMERQDELNALYEKFKGDVKQFTVQADPEQKDDDEEIIKRAKEAVNGEKFTDLWEGNWQKYYGSQSEGDFALVDMIAFYTKHIPQIDRLFLQSMLGQRDKAKRTDYRNYMIEKAFDNQLPEVDYEGFLREQHQLFLQSNAAAGTDTATEPGKRSSVASSTATATVAPLSADGASIVPEAGASVNPFPPGLLGLVAQFLYEAAPRPAIDIAMAGAIGLLAGITGRAYNVSNAGLNQYILLLAQTGTGKEAVASGIGKLEAAIIPSAATIVDYRGPTELVSAQGMVRFLADAKAPCIYSIVGEIGQKLREMSAPNANSHIIGLYRFLLDIYQKSGHNDMLGSYAYSDRTKNTPIIRSPSLTLFGETVPSVFYETLDDAMIANGLLPRFLIWEYNGQRSYLNTNRNVVPSLTLVQHMADLVAHCSQLMARGMVQNVELSPEAEVKSLEFDKWSTDLVNANEDNVVRHLWNRVHLKALKLAALRAVSENYLNPIMSLDHFMWASTMIVGQTERLIAKFETGQVGQAAATGEMKQLSEVIRTIREFLLDVSKYEKYGGRSDMCGSGVITETSIVRKLANTTAFKNDRMGGTFAIKRALKTLLDADDIQEMPKHQMGQLFGTKPRAFQISNHKRFDINMFGPQK